MWVLSNLLPITVDVFSTKQYENTTEKVGTIKPFQTLSVPNGIMSAEDTIIATYNGVPLTDKYTLHLHQPLVEIGATTYSFRNGTGANYASTGDISSVFLYNKLYLPINVYHNDRLVAQLDANDDMSIHGGSGSKLIFSNGFQGVNLGDTFSFQLAVVGMPQNKMSVTVNDIQTQVIHFGTIGGNFAPTFDDFDVYRIGI